MEQKDCKGGKCKNPVGRDRFTAATTRAKQIRTSEPDVPWQKAVQRAYCELHGDTRAVCKAKQAGKGKTKRPLPDFIKNKEKKPLPDFIKNKQAGKKKPCPKGHKNCRCKDKA
jgi:hypothetical protein